MSDEKILTRHPHGKAGVNISKEKYNQIRKFIMTNIDAEGEISFEEITDRAVEQLTDTFEGSVPWYIVTVKLDLEAKNVLERVPKVSPQMLRRPE